MSTRTIAQEAGVSAMTVSLALRGSPRISEPLRKRIVQLALVHGYAPDPRLAVYMGELRRKREVGVHAALALVALYPGADYRAGLPHLGSLLSGARQQAQALGYRLDEFQLHGDGMTPRRLRGMLEARGIQGILCLGSQNLDTEFPHELHQFSIVTMGLTVATRLHRVASHHLSDAATLFNELAARGYRCPGLIINPDWDARTGYAYSAACLLEQDRVWNDVVVPLRRMEIFDGAAFDRWRSEYAPDVLVLNQPAKFYAQIEAHLKSRGECVPQDLGIAFLGTRLVPEFYAGIAQNHELIGRCAVDLLAARLQQRDFGVPEHPKTELVEGVWVAGASLRAQLANGPTEAMSRRHPVGLSVGPHYH